MLEDATARSAGPPKTDNPRQSSWTTIVNAVRNAAKHSAAADLRRPDLDAAGPRQRLRNTAALDLFDVGLEIKAGVVQQLDGAIRWDWRRLIRVTGRTETGGRAPGD